MSGYTAIVSKLQFVKTRGKFSIDIGKVTINKTSNSININDTFIEIQNEFN